MDKFQAILKNYWGYDDFRGIQREIIESVTSGHDTLGLMPTGGGKSITFQVSALASDGMCLVVTPLIALMIDQVAQLKAKGIQAEAIHSGMGRDVILRILENAVFGAVKILYLSPERLASSLFLAKLQRMKVSLIAVDEAHCISQWGYDFRPHYLELAQIRTLLPGVPVLAVTATATRRVIEDIQKQLRFRERRVYAMSFKRPNLAYVVRRTDNKEEEMLHILSSVGGSAIVYVRTRSHTKQLSDLLNDAGINATYYHAGLDRAIKNKHQQQWSEGKSRVMVATNAFGMGINKDDVRMVLHYHTPDSIEAYFQEAGRAGRDGKKAYAVLLFASSDTKMLRRRIIDNYPDRDFIRQVYEELGSFFQVAEGMGQGHTFLFDIDRFSITYKHFPLHVSSALKLLAMGKYIVFNEENDARSRVKMLLERQELSRLNALSPRQEAVITAILRNYGGLFVDYVYIDEGLIAHITGETREELYLLLKGLSEMKILHYIPQASVPTITYLTPRLDTNQVAIRKDIYENRRELFEERINAMLSYVQIEHICRSRMLLAYFDDIQEEECGICDVCVEKKKHQASESFYSPEIIQILQLLSDKQPHDIDELETIGIKRSEIGALLRQLVLEERILVEGDSIKLMD